MKLKEWPVSFYRAFSLSVTPVNKLGRKGIANAKNCIVSLTTTELRLPIIHLTIRSLLGQSYQPEKVVLWVNDSLCEKIPSKLSSLIGGRFDIRYSTQNCSHRKLVESLKVFPDSVIVTCDDDEMYPPTWLERLWQDHQKFPRDVIAHECRRIAYHVNGDLLPYTDWRGEKAGESSDQTLAIGYGGVLYPVGCLHEDVLLRELYDDLAPRADDLWFKAMSLRNKTKTRRSSMPYPKSVPIAQSQQVSLKKYNIKEDGNRLQWQRLEEHFSFDLSRGGLDPRLGLSKGEDRLSCVSGGGEG